MGERREGGGEEAGERFILRNEMPRPRKHHTPEAQRAAAAQRQAEHRERRRAELERLRLAAGLPLWNKDQRAELRALLLECAGEREQTGDQRAALLRGLVDALAL